MTEQEGELWKARAEALGDIAGAAKTLYEGACWPWIISHPVGIIVGESEFERLGKALEKYQALARKEDAQ
jgi:hypothetical protein